MNEIWKEITWIPNLRGTYEVSNLGNARRTSLNWYNRYKDEYKTIYKIRNLTLYDNGHGYLHITLPINTEKGIKQKIFYIHRLVAEGFLENPDNKPEVNHKNFIRSDNRVSNLEWCTFDENMKHSSSLDERLKPYYPSVGSKCSDNAFDARHQRNKDGKIRTKSDELKYKSIIKTKDKSKNIMMDYRSSKKPLEQRNIYFENGKYTVRIGYKKKKIYVGRFESFEDAIHARIEKLKELHLLE